MELKLVGIMANGEMQIMRESVERGASTVVHHRMFQIWGRRRGRGRLAWKKKRIKGRRERDDNGMDPIL